MDFQDDCIYQHNASTSRRVNKRLTLLMRNKSDEFEGYLQEKYEIPVVQQQLFVMNGK